MARYSESDRRAEGRNHRHRRIHRCIHMDGTGHVECTIHERPDGIVVQLVGLGDHVVRVHGYVHGTPGHHVRRGDVPRDRESVMWRQPRNGDVRIHGAGFKLVHQMHGEAFCGKIGAIMHAGEDRERRVDRRVGVVEMDVAGKDLQVRGHQYIGIVERPDLRDALAFRGLHQRLIIGARWQAQHGAAVAFAIVGGHIAGIRCHHEHRTVERSVEDAIPFIVQDQARVAERQLAVCGVGVDHFRRVGGGRFAGLREQQGTLEVARACEGERAHCSLESGVAR